MSKTVTEKPGTASYDKESAASPLKKWESLGITSRFIFGKVMQQKEICLPLLQRLFPELDITDVEYSEAEKTMEGSIGSKGGRFDVYVKSPGRYAFTLEMRVVNEDHLPKRTRYYSAMMCEDLLAAGATYAPLPPAYVVMICSFDLFRKGLHRYTFSNRCSGDRQRPGRRGCSGSSDDGPGEHPSDLRSAPCHAGSLFRGDPGGPEEAGQRTVIHSNTLPTRSVPKS